MKQHETVGLAANWRDMARFETIIPIHLEGGVDGVTRDVSPNGVYFRADVPLNPGQPFFFTLEFTDPVGPLWLRAEGEVVRVDEFNGRRGIAARIVDSHLERDPH